jgi:hypothetical protein
MKKLPKNICSFDFYNNCTQSSWNWIPFSPRLGIFLSIMEGLSHYLAQYIINKYDDYALV